MGIPKLEKASSLYWKCPLSNILSYVYVYRQIDGLVQERCNSSALAIELRLSCNSTNPSIWLYAKLPYELSLNIKIIFPGIGIPFIKMRQSSDHFIFIMGISIPLRWYLYIEMVLPFLLGRWSILLLQTTDQYTGHLTALVGVLGPNMFAILSWWMGPEIVGLEPRDYIMEYIGIA